MPRPPDGKSLALTWSQRIWMVLLCSLGAGGIAVGELDARADYGAVILSALGTGVTVVALAEVILRLSRPSGSTSIQTLLKMLGVLLPIAAVASVVLGSVTPIILVVVFGGMALPIMWGRR